jgi:hypothetical protein
MKFYSFQIVIEKEKDDPGYYAYSPALPGWARGSGLAFQHKIPASPNGQRLRGALAAE